MTNTLKGAPVLVVGAGIMGAGIAQVAAQAGHSVLLFDARDGAAAQAKDKLGKTFEGLVVKGKLSADDAAQTLSRITALRSLDEAAGVRLVVEAIVEKLDAKRSLFQQLETIVPADCVLASNTSSISVTAIANGLQHPQRLVGMHFFNPVPLMKLVEVVSGLQTDAAVASNIFDLSKDWGKVPVHARSTPGFIVNRIARPYYAEALALLQEQTATPAVLDACLRGAGFRMGPCELMDLIGHDTNFAVTQSVFEANFYDKRFVPSLVQRELVDGGLLGRKSGRGFYAYPQTEADKALQDNALMAAPQLQPTVVTVVGNCAWAGRMADALTASGIVVTRDTRTAQISLRLPGGGELRPTDGRSASQLAFETNTRDIAVFDWSVTEAVAPGTALAFAVASGASETFASQAAGVLAAAGWHPLRVGDVAGLVVARTIAMLVNEGADAVLQGVCSPESADAAMKLGVNYPAGPFEWLARVGATAVVDLLDRLDNQYRGERYRVSPWLRNFS